MDFIQCFYLVNMLGWFCSDPVLQYSVLEDTRELRKAFVAYGATLLLTCQSNQHIERIFLLYQHTLWLSPLHLLTCSSKHTRYKTCLKSFKIYWPLTMTQWSIFFHCQESGLVNSSWLIFSPVFGVGGKFEVWKHSNPRWNQTYPNQAWTTHWVCISPSHATTLIADWTPWQGLCLWYFLINLWNKYIPSSFG